MLILARLRVAQAAPAVAVVGGIAISVARAFIQDCAPVGSLAGSVVLGMCHAQQLVAELAGRLGGVIVEVGHAQLQPPTGAANLFHAALLRVDAHDLLVQRSL
jgi:hypothetical protein